MAIAAQPGSASRPPDCGTEPRWLREHYQDRQRGLKDIAAETGIPGRGPRRRSPQGRHPRSGTASTAAPIPSLPSADPAHSPPTSGTPSHPGAEQRIRRLLPSPASSASATQPAIWASGTPSSLARSASSRHRRHHLAAHRTRRAAHADGLRPSLRPRRPSRPEITHSIPEEQERQSRNVTPSATRDCSLTWQPARRELFNYNETPSSRCSSSRDPYTGFVGIMFR
jgi:hypothetical protein